MTPSQIPSEISQIASPGIDPFVVFIIVALFSILFYFIIDVLAFKRRSEAYLYEQRILSKWHEKQEKERREREMIFRNVTGESAFCSRCENIFQVCNLKRHNHNWFCKLCIPAGRAHW